jgi:4-methylaminobutanoate oxidase (formaldehyde-forming)
LIPAGYRAIDSLRLEKGYRYWSADITPERNPLEAGMGFCVKFDKGDFIGREALLKIKEKGPTEKLCCLTLQDPLAIGLGGEPVKVEGKITGRITSGGYGYTIGKSIAYAYLPAESAKPGVKVSVEIFGDWISGEISSEPLYDPEMKKIKV